MIVKLWVCCTLLVSGISGTLSLVYFYKYSIDSSLCVMDNIPLFAGTLLRWSQHDFISSQSVHLCAARLGEVSDEPRVELLVSSSASVGATAEVMMTLILTASCSQDRRGWHERLRSRGT